MFNRISSRYDLLNDVLSLGFQRGWRSKAVGGLCAEVGGSVLDLACGTGDFVRAYCRAHRPERVVCADLSPGMLRRARRKLEGVAGDVGVEFVQCSAEALPFGDASFDVILIGYGVRNFVDLGVAMGECARVLKPGGCMVILELSYPQGRWYAPFYGFYLLHVLPFVGGLFSGSLGSYRYLSRSIGDFARSGLLPASLASADLVVERESGDALGAVRILYVRRGIKSESSALRRCG